MKLSKIIQELNLDIVAGYNDIDKEVKGVYIGDLLSLVMARAQEEDIWITIQTHVNIVAVATLVNMSAILVAEGMNIDDVIARLRGIECGRKGTSCPDQIAIALEKIKKGEI